MAKSSRRRSRRSRKKIRARSKTKMRDQRLWRAASHDDERSFWKSIAQTRNLRRILDVPPPTVLQTLYNTRVSTILQSLQVWTPHPDVKEDDIVLSDKSFEVLGRYLDLKASDSQIVLHRPHISLLFDTTTWNVSSAIRTLSNSMKEGRRVVLKTRAGGTFRILHPDEVVFQPDPVMEMDKEIEEKMARLTTVPSVKLLNRTTASAASSATSVPDAEAVSRRFYDETQAALEEFKERQKKALEQRLDRDGAKLEMETHAMMQYLQRYSSAANHMWITLRDTWRE